MSVPHTSKVSPITGLRHLYGRSPAAKPLCAKAATTSRRSMLPLGSSAACTENVPLCATWQRFVPCAHPCWRISSQQAQAFGQQLASRLPRDKQMWSKSSPISLQLYWTSVVLPSSSIWSRVDVARMTVPGGAVSITARHIQRCLQSGSEGKVQAAAWCTCK